MSERHIELTWRCSACKHRNLGRHMECEGCGKPKDDSEEYEMPADTRSAATVEDPKLLAMAKAGANWRCEYCGSDRRDLDGGCARCGAGRKEGANRAERGGHAPRRDREMSEATPVEPFRGSRMQRAPATPLLRDARFWRAVVVIAFIGGGACWMKSKMKARREAFDATPTAVTIEVPPLRTEFTATVQAVQWQTKITVDRWQLAPHEGFTADLPREAVNVKAAGEHFHHDEDVYDHDETVYDDVEVPDGVRTETYTDRVACGQNCTPSTRSCHQVCTNRPQSCHEVCTNSKNGFASCHDVCTGGGRDCHDECSGSDGHCETKYCDETKTRSIPKTRTEHRPRVVKKYRQVARNAPWSTYQLWEWVPVRDAVAAGDDGSPRWEDAGALAEAGASDAGGAEREVRSETMSVNLLLDDHSTQVYHPASEDELATFSAGQTLRVRIVNGRLAILRDGD